MAEQWLSIVEYARTFGISDMTIRRRIRTGKIQAVLRDGKYFIPVAPERVERVRPTPTKTETIRPEHTIYPSGLLRESKTQNQNAGPMPRVVRHDIEPSSDASQLINPNQYGNLPSHITHQFETKASVTVESRLLLDFCDKAMKTNIAVIQALEQQFEAKAQSYKDQIALKDSNLEQMKQQVEDLQVLIEILERKLK